MKHDRSCKNFVSIFLFLIIKLVAFNQEDAGVQYIISSVISALRSHPERRYIQVETAFFWKWWQNQNTFVRQDVLDLLNNGQLEIINGAWSMNDEAATHYHSTIDQYTWGFRILNDSLGECSRPKIGWQIDPFGHSREQASLLNQMGFRALIIGRIDFRDKEERRLNANLDFLWKASDSLANPYIFTSMFPDLYVSEPGFCFDILCNDKTINDDPESPDYNLPQKVDQFAQRMDSYINYYSTSNYMVPMGGDFNYQAAEITFSNLDKLIKGFKNHSKYEVFYSTPSCFVEAVNKEINDNSISLKEKFDDFFPYASDPHSYWTGYFTSRPTLKRFERVANNILQSAKQLVAFSKSKNLDFDTSLNDLRSVLGILQHHDAITGTQKQAVADDYSRLLHKSLKKAEEPIGHIIGNLLAKNGTVDLKLATCFLANVSICLESNQEKFLVVVQNPLSRVVTHFVKLPVNGTNFKIFGPDGEEEYDVFDTIHTFDFVKENVKAVNKELVFAARALPALGLKLYYIEAIKNGDGENYRPFKSLETDENYFGTEPNGFHIDSTTGKLTSITLKGKSLNIAQDFFYYTGVNTNNDRASGAYVFHPNENEAIPLVQQPLGFKWARGIHLDQVYQVFNDEVRQIVRTYKGENDSYIEFDWLVGNLQYVDHKAKEIVTKFKASDFKNEGVFFTDSNGREQIKRELDKRLDFRHDSSEEPVTSNYYPVTTKIVIRDENKDLEIAVLNDRAQGGSSLHEGEIELMIHRACTRDDNFGVAEILNEKQYGVGLYARGQHYLTFGSVETIEEDGLSIAAFERELVQRKLLAPWVLVGGTISPVGLLQEQMDFQFEGMTRSLPVNVQILTFEPWKGDSYLVRFEHIMEKDEDAILSQPVTVDIQGLFSIFEVTEMVETTLGANQFLDEYNEEEKLIWNGIIPSPVSKLSPERPLKFELGPMQIRTFIVKVARK